MTVTVNGSPCEVGDAPTLADLVETALGHRRAPGVAVAVNETVVRRSAWEEHRVRPGDRVEIVTAVQGG